MRFVLRMVPRVSQHEDEAAVLRTDAVYAMLAHNVSLEAAAAMWALDGPSPQRAEAPVQFTGGKHMITDGPFIETREALGAGGSSTSSPVPSRARSRGARRGDGRRPHLPRRPTFRRKLT